MFVDSANMSLYTLPAMATSGLETIISLAGFRVTNTFVATFFVDAVIIALIFLLKKRISLVPEKFQGIVETIVDYLYSTTEQVAGPRAAIIFPWVSVFFIYIAMSNLIGLLPGFGTIGFFRAGGFVPLLRASTSDLNVTLALAVVSVIATHTLAIRTTGLGSYLKRFFALNPLLLFVGLMEIVQEVTKLLSFSFRLFGNISAGESVLGTMASISAFVLPIPFLGLELLVAVIQALIFSLLTLAFMSILTETHAKSH
jgi:F-type H+-transporting ATPase subunit a